MYPGWYDDQPLEGLEQRFEETLKDHRKWLEENGQDKPFLISEFGAGAVPGERTFEKGRRWTENYQQELVKKALEALVNSCAVQGFYIWQFCDCRTALMSKISIGRPRTFNNKGLVDEHRKPKLAYYAVKQLLNNISTFK
jgi:beta-glucuronidase